MSVMKSTVNNSDEVVHLLTYFMKLHSHEIFFALIRSRCSNFLKEQSGCGWGGSMYPVLLSYSNITTISFSQFNGKI